MIDDDNYEDDSACIPMWPRIRLQELKPECEFHIYDQCWLDNPELNITVVKALLELRNGHSLIEMGRDHQFEYNWLTTTRTAAFMLLIRYPELTRFLTHTSIHK